MEGSTQSLSDRFSFALGACCYWGCLAGTCLKCCLLLLTRQVRPPILPSAIAAETCKMNKMKTCLVDTKIWKYYAWDQSARINISMQCAGSFFNTEVYTLVLGFFGCFLFSEIWNCAICSLCYANLSGWKCWAFRTFLVTLGVLKSKQTSQISSYAKLQTNLKNQVNCHIYPSVNTIFSSAILQFYLLERIRLSYLKPELCSSNSFAFQALYLCDILFKFYFMHVNNTLLTSVHFQRKPAHTWQLIHQNQDKPCERRGNATRQCNRLVQILSYRLNIPLTLRLPTTDPNNHWDWAALSLNFLWYQHYFLQVTFAFTPGTSSFTHYPWGSRMRKEHGKILCCLGGSIALCWK